MTWREFYISRVVNTKYEYYFIDKYALFLDTLDSQKGKTFLETGCGTGLVTKLVYHPKRKFTLLDNDLEMLGLAINRLVPLPIRYVLGDIRTPMHQQFDVIYSHGVLEHLSLAWCIKIIQNQLAIGKILVHYVPTNKYTTPSFGDENLISRAQWEDALKPTKSIAFNEGKDLLLIWKGV